MATISLDRFEIANISPSLYVFSISMALYLRCTYQSIRLLYGFYYPPPQPLYYVSPRQARKLRQRLGYPDNGQSNQQLRQRAAIICTQLPSIPGAIPADQRNGSHRPFPYLPLASLIQALSGLILCIIIVFYFIYLQRGCRNLHDVTLVLFQFNTTAMDLILVYKAYVLSKSSLQGIPHYLAWFVNIYTLSLLGAALLLAKHGLFFATQITSTDRFLHLDRHCGGLLYNPTLLLLAAGFDAAGFLFLGLVFLGALGLHIKRVLQTTQSRSVLSVYLDILRSDTLQLLLSTIASLFVLIIYALANNTLTIRFYPVILAHAITSVFMVEALRQTMRRRRKSLYGDIDNLTLVLHL